VIITILSPVFLPKSVKDWAQKVEYNPVRFFCNDDRIAVYIHSFRMIKSHPFIGVGANAFMNSYKGYKTYPEYKGIVTLDGMKAHNNYLHMAAEVGLFGFGIFAWFLLAVFKQLKRILAASQDNLVTYCTVSLIACLIAFLINGLTESSLFYSRVAPLFWFLIGYSLSFKNLYPVSQKSVYEIPR